MSPKSSLELLETIEAGNHFIFTVVRHPFDRLISAYRDRILKGCTDQAKYHIPGIFSLTRKHILTLGTRQLFDKTTNCIKVFPTFQEFIQYVVEKYKNPDPHWTSYHQVSKETKIYYRVVDYVFVYIYINIVYCKPPIVLYNSKKSKDRIILWL